MDDEGIMLLGSTSCKRSEPMGVVTGTIVDSPTAHTFGDNVGELAADRLLVGNGVLQSLVGVFRKIFKHLAAVEYHFAIILLGTLGGSFDSNSFAVESLLHHFES